MRESPFVRDRRRPSTALVTGGAGFVGSAVVRRLRRDGVRVVVLDALTSAGSHARLEASLGANCLFVEGDVTDARAVAELLRRVRPDVVFHLAAETRDDRSSDPLRLVHANVVGTAVLLDEGLRYWSELPASRRNAFRFIQVSSDDVFGGLGAHGLFSASTPHRPSSPGAASRSAAGLLAGSWYRTHGFPAIVTHGAENFGPHQFPEQFIPRAIRRALQYDAVRVTGAGDQSRDWLFVGDHADGLVAAWRRGLPGQTYLFGGGEERQDLHVAREICSLVDRFAPHGGRPERVRLIEHVSDEALGESRRSSDISAARSALGWAPATTFEEGLRRTVGWYLGHHAGCETVLADADARDGLGLGEAA